jgi:hypothetical protein
MRCPLNDIWSKANMEINICVFLKDGTLAFRHPPPSQNGWIIDITALQHVWRTVKGGGF